MPIGVPKVEYRLPGDSEADWIDLYNCLYRQRMLFLCQELDDEIGNQLISLMLYLNAEDPEQPLFLYINSPGGSVTCGIGIYDIMRYLNSGITTICMGTAASMGSFILAGGTYGRRLSLPNARMMIHQPEGGSDGQASEILSESTEVARIRRLVGLIYANRTQQSIERIAQDMDRDQFMSAQEAKDYGLIDLVAMSQKEEYAPGYSLLGLTDSILQIPSSLKKLTARDVAAPVPARQPVSSSFLFDGIGSISGIQLESKESNNVSSRSNTASASYNIIAIQENSIVDVLPPTKNTALYTVDPEGYGSEGSQKGIDFKAVTLLPQVRLLLANGVVLETESPSFDTTSLAPKPFKHFSPTEYQSMGGPSDLGACVPNPKLEKKRPPLVEAESQSLLDILINSEEATEGLFSMNSESMATYLDKMVDQLSDRFTLVSLNKIVAESINDPAAKSSEAPSSAKTREQTLMESLDQISIQTLENLAFDKAPNNISKSEEQILIPTTL